ncbi:MAG: 4a-hydroxytetrahydrobiopterin dehydratase [Rubrivivax sp.]
MDRLDAATLDDLALTLPGWQLEREQGGRLRRTFEFPGFAQAFAFMTEVALAAERLNHHPDWSNSFNRVDICLTTHDAGGLTRLDVELAQTVDRASARLLG